MRIERCEGFGRKGGAMEESTASLSEEEEDPVVWAEINKEVQRRPIENQRLQRTTPIILHSVLVVWLTVECSIYATSD